MERLLTNFGDLFDRIKEGSRQLHYSDYPFVTLWVGVFSFKFDNFQETHHLFEILQATLARGKITTKEYLRIIKQLYKNPKWLFKLKDILLRISKNQTINLQEQFKHLQPSNPIESRTTSKDTIILEQNKNNDQQRSPTNSLTQEYIQEQKNLLDDMNLAKQLQQQQNILAEKANFKDQALCEICYVGLYQQDFTLLDKCSHLFHSECLKETFKINILENRFPLVCPNDECKVEVLDMNIRHILQELYKKYEQHTLKSYADMHGDSVSWCPTADCSYMFFYQKGDDVRFQCLECKKEYCLACRAEWHKDMTCKQYQISNTNNEDDAKFLDFVKGKKFKQCPKCKFWVQKNQGCDHMTCKCKFQFCYKCGGVYMKCECVQKAKQLQKRRIEQAENRRKKRQQKEQKMKSKVEEPKRASRQRNKK